MTHGPQGLDPSSLSGDGRPTRPEANGSVTGSQGVAEEDLSGVILAGRYRLTKKIGEGGMGAVYLGTHTTINKPVAVKVLSAAYRSRRDVVGRFLQEARAASAIRHEHIVDITDFGTGDDGTVFLVMEYLEGCELCDLIQDGQPIPWSRARAVMLQILDALALAHDTGIVHRDMKPQNCFMISRSNNSDYVKVLDFGIAKVDNGEDEERLTRTGVIMGTANYMSPEQAHGAELDHRTDLYSVGVMFYELLTGQLPFLGNNPMSVMYKHLHVAATPPSQIAPDAEIPAAVEAVVMRALQKKPEERFQNAREFINSLESLDAAADAEAAARNRQDRPKFVLYAGIAAAVLITVGVIAGVIARSGAKGDDEVSDNNAALALADDDDDPQGLTADEPEAEDEPGEPVADDEPDEPAAVDSPADDPALVDPTLADPTLVDPTLDDPTVVDVGGIAKVGIPTKRGTADIRRLLNRKAKKAGTACLEHGGAFPGEKVKVSLTIAPDGKVSAAKVGSKYSGKPLGRCIEGAVKKVKFDPARKEQSASYTFSR